MRAVMGVVDSGIPPTHRTHRSRVRITVVAVVVTAAWIGVVALVAAEHGSQRRLTFDGTSGTSPSTSR